MDALGGVYVADLDAYPADQVPREVTTSEGSGSPPPGVLVGVGAEPDEPDEPDLTGSG